MTYAYVNPHHLSNKVDKLNNDLEGFLNDIGDDRFSSRSTWLKNNNQVKLMYFDASKNSQKGSIAKEYQDQNGIEKEVTKLSLFYNNGNKDGLFFTPSPSDKTTFSTILAPKISVPNGTFRDGVLSLNQELENELFDLLVMSEIDRINQVVSDFKTIDKNKLIEGYHYGKTTDGSYKPGTGAYFFVIPELNSLPRQEDGSIATDLDTMKQAREIMNDFISSEISYKQNMYDTIGVAEIADKNMLNGYMNNTGNMAADFIINSMVSYINQYMLFTGDPSRFGKLPKKFTGEFSDYNNVIDSTLPNLFKRMAKDIAPGTEGFFRKSEQQYRVLFINEPKKDSLLAKEGDEYKKAYSNINIADAQEWTTLEEHIRVMRAYGQLTNEEYNNILANKDNLTVAQIKKVLQPIKPVQVSQKLSNDFHGVVDYYIKTSSFPLISQLTKGFPELDKMRQFMENPKNKIDRVVPKTAVKLGFHKSIELFKDNKFNNDNGFELNNVIVLNREGFRIQQDVPYDPNKKEILEGSQMRKVIFGDIEASEDFNGKSAKDLKNEADLIHKEQYNRRLNDLKRKLKVDSNGRITNMDELKAQMIEEGESRGYSINDLLMLETTTLTNGNKIFDMPLFFHTMVHKIESLLNSVVKNKVLKNKLPGKSFVQGSSLGFEATTKEFYDRIAGTEGAPILTKDFKGDLDYRYYNGELFAEVMIPSIFKGIDLTQYVDKNGFLDTNRIDPELLNMIGYRIPTQGHSSIIRLKIVGILPEIAGDLIIIPSAMTVQMGSDFDVDKLYVHYYNYMQNSKGNLVKDVPFGDLADMKDEQLQNRLLDIYHTILSNKSVQEMNKQPLDNDNISNLTDGNDAPLKSTTKISNSVVSDQLNSQMVDVQAAGKIGIGISSTWVTGHTNDQYAGTYISPVYDSASEKTMYHSVRFSLTNDDINKYNDHDELIENEVDGKKEYSLNQKKPNTPNSSNKYKSHAFKGAFRLDKIKGFFGRNISSVLINIQTESVDNANNGRLSPMGLNKQTFDVAMLIGSVGFEENIIGYFLNQPIIKYLVKELNRLDNFTDTEFVKNKRDVFKAELLSKLGIDTPLGLLEVENISLEEMNVELNSSNLNSDLQKRVLSNFFVYEKIATELRGVRQALNVDTKYLGSSFSGVVNRKNNFESKMNTKYIGNTYNLYNNTTAGSAYDTGVEQVIELFGSKNLLPYDSNSMVEIFKVISEETDRDLSDKDIESITIGIRSALWNSVFGKIYPNSNTQEVKNALLFGENNIAKLTIEAQQKYPNNPFLRKLNPKLSTDKTIPSTVEHYSAKDVKENYSFEAQKGWLELLNMPKDTLGYKAAMNLMTYSIIFGTERNARDFGRFIPVDFLRNNGFPEELRNIDFNSETNPYINELMENFIQQYFQHNPNKLQTLNEFTTSTFAKKYNEKTKRVEIYRKINDAYKKLDRLGSDFITEYDLSKTIVKTIFPSNDKGMAISPSEIRTNEPDMSFEKENSGINVLNAYNFDAGINGVLDAISAANNEYSELAAYFKTLDNRTGLEVYDKQDDNHTKGLLNKDSVFGRYLKMQSGFNKIVINPARMSNETDFFVTFFHELTHSKVNDFLLTDEKLLSSEQIKVKRSLEDIFNVAKSKNTDKLYDYYFDSLPEFVSGLMSDKKFQDYLNNIQYKNKSIFERIVDLLRKLFPNVKEGSALDVALQNTFKIIEDTFIKSDTYYQRVSYPNTINGINSNKLLEIKDELISASFDDGTIVDQRFPKDPLLKDYGMTDGQYKYVSKNKETILKLIKFSEFNELIEETASRLLKESAIINDIRQLSLFEDTSIDSVESVSNLVSKSNLDILNKDVTLSNAYKSLIDSWDIYGDKLEANGITKELLANMNGKEIGEIIKKHIC